MFKRIFVFEDKSDAVEFNGVFDYIKFKILPVLTLSGFTGIIAGIIITIFNHALEKLSEISSSLSALVHGNLPYLPLYAAVFAAVLAFISYFIIKKLPEARGSGIPRTEAILNGKKKYRPLRTALGTIFGSFISFVGGLSVGSEGPSVQLGASIGLGVEKFGGSKSWSKSVASGGAAAGFACAFGAPLTGIIFVQEEVHRKINPLTVAACCFAVAYAYAVRTLLSPFFGISTFYFGTESVLALPSGFLWIAVVIGAACSIVSLIFNRIILLCDKVVRKKRIKPLYFLLALFMITAVVNVFFPDNFGSGITVIRALANGNLSDIGPTSILLILKIVFVAACFFTGATGGMMVPMLAIGALLGGILAYAFIAAGLPQIYFAVVVLITMCCFFGDCIAAPFTVIMLFLETTGGGGALLPLVLAVFVSSILNRVIKSEPLYDELWSKDVDADMISNEFVQNNQFRYIKQINKGSK